MEAGILCSVHRATLHRWLKRGWIRKNEETGWVETDQIVDRLKNRRSTKGRAAGGAYRKARLSKVGDIGVTLERAVVILSGIFKTLSPSEQSWFRKEILEKIGDPKLLEHREQSPDTSQIATVETKQEQEWNNVLVRATLTPKVHIMAPDIQAWGEKLKRRALLKVAGIAEPEERPTEPPSIIASSNPTPKEPDAVLPDSVVPHDI